MVYCNAQTIRPILCIYSNTSLVISDVFTRLEKWNSVKLKCVKSLSLLLVYIIANNIKQLGFMLSFKGVMVEIFGR